jgi:hypothetical protein
VVGVDINTKKPEESGGLFSKRRETCSLMRNSKENYAFDTLEQVCIKVQVSMSDNDGF